MSDRNDIIQKLNLYGFVVDTQQWDLFDTVFSPFVDADFGGSAHWTDLAQFKHDFAAFQAGFCGFRMVITNTLQPSLTAVCASSISPESANT